MRYEKIINNSDSGDFLFIQYKRHGADTDRWW
jgi:hypothetical protein